MIKYGTLDEIKVYRDNPAVSQTYLKQLLSGKAKMFKPTLASLKGSYFDCLITMPDFIDEVYVVTDIKRPTETITLLVESFTNHLLETFPYDYEFNPTYVSTDLNSYQAELEQWILTTDYYTNRKPDWRITEFIKNGADWWKTLIELGEKEIITTTEKALVEQAYTRLYTNTQLNWILTDKGQDVYFQLPVYWEEMGVQCKGLVDILLASTLKPELTEIDIKYTTCPTIETWFAVAMTLGYPIQKAFYKSGLEKSFKMPVSKSYWLVCSPYWTKLVPVDEDILSHGHLGGTLVKGTYTLTPNITGNKVIKTIIKKFEGYREGLRLYKNALVDTSPEVILSEERTQELFLKNIY